jgi:hypothetical protein
MLLSGKRPRAYLWQKELDMSDVSYQDIVEALRKDVGARWFGPEQEGRVELKRALRDNLNLGDDQADDMLTTLIDNGTVRYVHDRLQVADRPVEETRDVAEGLMAPALPGGGTVAAWPAGSTAPIVAPVVPAEGYNGYWEIGSEGEDADLAGRRGQVRPRE